MSENKGDLIGILLILFLLIGSVLSKNIDINPIIKTVFLSIMFIVVISFAIISCYKEFKAKRYSTTKFIVLNDILFLIILILYAVIYFKYDMNTEIMAPKSREVVLRIEILILLSMFSTFLKTFLTRDKFLIEKDNNKNIL